MPHPGPALLHSASSDEDVKGGLVSQAPPSEDFIHEVLAINTLAMQRTKVECLEEAMEMLTEVFDKLSKEDAETTVGDLQMLDQLRATTLNNMGVTECRRGQPRKALSHFEGSRQLEEKWNIASPSVVLNTCAAYNTLQIFDKSTSAALETIEMLRTLELQKKWTKKQTKQGEKERRMGLGLLRDVSYAPSSVSSKAHGSGLTGGGRRGVSLASSAMVPKTSAQRLAAKEEKAMLNAAAFPTVARSENAALWGAAWHNLGVAQLNIARQAKDPSEYSNALAIFENAMRTTYDKLGIHHPMSIDVTATFRHVRGLLLKNGAYKPHRTMKHAVLPPVDPRVQLLENLKVEPEDGESHTRALENRRKDLSVTFRGEVTGGRKLVERIDPTPYPDGGREAYQQRSPRRHRSHRRGGSFPQLLDVPLSLPYNPTLIAATKIYGNPHPLLDPGVGVHAREWTPDRWSGREAETQATPPSSSRRSHDKRPPKRSTRKARPHGRPFPTREADGSSGGMADTPQRSSPSHERRHEEGRRRHQRGPAGSGESAPEGPNGESRAYAFLNKCPSERSRSVPLSQRNPLLAEEAAARREKTKRKGEERRKRAAGTRESGSGGGTFLEGPVERGRGEGGAPYALHALEQVYGSEIPKPAQVGYGSVEGGANAYSQNKNRYTSDPPSGSGPRHGTEGYQSLELQYMQPPNAYPGPSPLSQPLPPQGQARMAQAPPSVLAGFPPSFYPPQPFTAVPPLAPNPPFPAARTTTTMDNGVPPDGYPGYPVGSRPDGSAWPVPGTFSPLPPLPMQKFQSPPYPYPPDPSGIPPPILPCFSHETEHSRGGGVAAPYLFASNAFGQEASLSAAAPPMPPAPGVLPPTVASQPQEGKNVSPFPTPASQVSSTSSLPPAEDHPEAWMQSKLLLLAEPPAPSPFLAPTDGGVPWSSAPLVAPPPPPPPPPSSSSSSTPPFPSPGLPSMPMAQDPRGVPPDGYPTIDAQGGGGGGIPSQLVLSQGSPFPKQSTESLYETPPTGFTVQGNGMDFPNASPLPTEAAGFRGEGGTGSHPSIPTAPTALSLAPEVTNVLLTDAESTAAVWGETEAEGPNALFGAMWVVADPRLLPTHQTGATSILTPQVGYEGNTAPSLSTAYSGGSRPHVLEITEDGTPSSDGTGLPPTRQALESQLYSKPALMMYSDDDGARSSSSSMESLSRPYSRM